MLKFIRMADQIGQNQNSWQAPAGGAAAQETAPGAPPPPPEVKVRTFKSDLESMASGGGGDLPKFQSVQAPALAVSVSQKTAKAEAAAVAAKPNSLWTAAIAAVALALLAAVGYLAYEIFGTGQKQAPSGGTAPAATALPQSPAGAGGGAQPSNFSHKSFFGKPPDTVFDVVMHATAGNASDLQTYGQKLAALAGGMTQGDLFEVDAENSDGGNMTAEEIFAAGDISVLDQALFSANFNPDSTVFIYKNTAGLWPGYILALDPSKNWLFLKNDVQKLEQSPKIPDFFLSAPGAPAATGFKDTIVGGQPARILNFSNASTSFLYGWFRNYLILSTSADGLKEAIGRL